MNLFHSFFTKTNEILLRAGEKRAVFPQEPIAAEKLLCDASECASLAGKLTEAFLCRQKRNYFISIIIVCVTEAPMVSAHTQKKEEGRNEQQQ